MSNNRITPFIKRMRTNGGTIYTFSSALEDIGLNINERNNIVKISHFALLDLPNIKSTPNDNTDENYFNILNIPGAWEYEQDPLIDKDGKILIAESFQNYVLNFEANLLNQETYNPSLQRTVSERVFWKWLKETGAIRWDFDGSINNKPFFVEEADVSEGVGYESVVKYIGKVSAGNIRTDQFGTYNETYVLVPTSHGQTQVWFEQFEDDNYRHNIEIGNLGENILGRETFTGEHPDGLSYKAYYDFVDQPDLVGNYFMQFKDASGNWQDGWWYTAEGITPSSIRNTYLTDTDNYLINDVSLNTDLKYNEGSIDIIYKRSKVDCISLVFEEDKIKTLFEQDPLTNPADLIDFNYDKMAINLAINDNFNFNAVLIYYTIYNSTMDEVLGRNLLGVLFLDAAEGNKGLINGDGIVIPSLEKIQSTTNDGFGTSYSLRLNIKTDNIVDDTNALIVDEATSDQLYTEDWNQAFINLNNAVNILTQNNSTINYISEKYTQVANTQSQIINDIQALQWEVNNLNLDIIKGTPNTVPIFGKPGENIVKDSSIYMNEGNVGIFNQDPQYPIHIDGDITKVKNIILENKILDISGNILLGYGSPLTIGDPSSKREVAIYTGNNEPILFADTSNNLNIKSDTIFEGAIKFDSSVSLDVAEFKENLTIIDSQDRSLILGTDNGLIPGFIFNNRIIINGDVLPNITSNNLGNLSNPFKTVFINPDNKNQETDILYWNSTTYEVKKGTLSPFTGLENGLVPAPGYSTPQGKVLADNGDWIEVTSGSDITNITVSSPITGGGNTGTVNIGINQASNSQDGYLSSTDWNTFNDKVGDVIGLSAIIVTTIGKDKRVTHNTVSGYKHIPSGGTSGQILVWDSDGTAKWSAGNPGDITSVGVTGPLTGGGLAGDVTIGINQASNSQDGYLSSTDWNIFNNKGNGTVTSISTGTGLTGGPITTTGTISHSTGSGFEHLPTGGTSGKILGWATGDKGVWIDAPSGGGINSVSANSPLSASTVSGDVTISLAQASGSQNGYLSSTDWNTFNNKTSNNGTVTQVSTSAPLTGNITTSGTIGITQSSGSQNGYLSSGDWNTFNNKVGTVSANSPLSGSISNGSLSISISKSNGGTNGYLSSTDWNRFDGKIGSASGSGAISVNTSGTSITVSHSTAAGYKHIPTGGTSGQYLVNNGSGSVTWSNKIISSISNFSDNRIITASGSNTMNGESTLTYNGTSLSLSASNSQIKHVNGTASYPSYSFSSDSDSGIYLNNTGEISMSTGGTERFRLVGDNLHISGEVTAFSTTPSDIRLKENVKIYDNSLEKVLKLQGVEFIYKSTGEKHLGFIAQDIENIIPEVVKEREILGKEGKFKMVRYTEVIPVLTNAIKEINNKVEHLENIIKQQQEIIEKQQEIIEKLNI